MSSKKKPHSNIVVVLLLLLGLSTLFTLQFGLINQGQEFGTYGQYNRVLNVVRKMDGYTVVNSRLSRRLDWRNLGYLDSFSVRIRDQAGKVSSVEFLRGSPEMQERDRGALERIIKAKMDGAK